MTAAVVLGLRDDGPARAWTTRSASTCRCTGPAGAVRLRELLGHAGGLQREPDGRWWERHAGVAAGRADRPASPRRRSRSAATPATTTPTSGTGCSARVIERVTGERGGTRCGPGCSARSAWPAPRTSPRSRSPAATSCIRGTRRCARSPATTPGRWPRPGSSGPLWMTWPGGRPHLAGPGQRRVARRRRVPAGAEMAAPGGHRRPGRLDQPGTAWACSCGGAASGCCVGHTGSMPGYLAVARRSTGRPVPVWWPSRTRTPSSACGIGAARAIHHGGRARHASRRRRRRRGGPSSAAAARGRSRCAGVWWWMGLQFEVGWDAGPVRTGRSSTPRAGAPSLAFHRRGRRPVARHQRREHRRGAHRPPRRRTAPSSRSTSPHSCFTREPLTHAGHLTIAERPNRCTLHVPAGTRDTAAGRPYALLHVLRTDPDRRRAPLGAVRDLGTGLARRHRVLRRRGRRDRRRRGAPGPRRARHVDRHPAAGGGQRAVQAASRRDPARARRPPATRAGCPGRARSRPTRSTPARA